MAYQKERLIVKRTVYSFKLDDGGELLVNMESVLYAIVKHNPASVELHFSGDKFSIQGPEAEKFVKNFGELGT